MEMTSDGRLRESKAGMGGSARSCAGMDGEETIDEKPLRGSSRFLSANRGEVIREDEPGTIMLAGRRGDEGMDCLATGWRSGT